MYHDEILQVTYTLVYDYDEFGDIFFNFVYYLFPLFLSLLGIKIGVSILKSCFS